MYFYAHNCTSPSNDYSAVACSNSNQAWSHISSLLISRHLTRLTVVRDAQFGLPAILNNSLASYQSVAMTGSWHGNQKIAGALHVPVAEPPFLKSNLPLHRGSKCSFSFLYTSLFHWEIKPHVFTASHVLICVYGM